MRVYLIQHGLAKHESEDAERPLSDQGREDVTRTAELLSLFEKPAPLKILHSGKLRAKQTAEMFAQAWGDIDVEEILDLKPNADPSVWSAHVASMQKDVALVGHLPHLSGLAGLLLCGATERAVIGFRHGGVLCLEYQNQATWQVCWQMNPTMLYSALP